MENAEKHRDIELLLTEGKRNYLLSELNYHKTKLCSKNLLAIELKKKNNQNY